MKILLTILLILAGIIVLLLIIALFARKDYAVEREVKIDRPLATVFDYIRYLKNQDNFSKWATMDPAMRKSYRGTDGTVGFVSAWESSMKGVGKGEQEITGVTEGERIDYEIRFIKPFEARASAYLKTTALSENQTLVTWGFTSSMKYPTNLMLLFMDMEKSIGNDFETGLKNLKDVIERQ